MKRRTPAALGGMTPPLSLPFHGGIAQQPMAMVALLLSLLSLLSLSPLPFGRASEAEAVPADASHVFHIIAHSHCDPGWLNTFEGYYMADVRGILDSVLTALQKDASRRFVWSETSYFARWWEVSSQQQRAAFRRALAAGQFEFVNGGWSQHDEACPDPLSMLQQMTTGHQYLLQQFGVVPRVAWQIDPFGHSAVTPTLFRMMGMQALVINRIHFTIKDYFKEQRHMEFIWRGSHQHSHRHTDACHSTQHCSADVVAITSYTGAQIRH